MAVKIRLKPVGKKHRWQYRICAMDVRSPRGGRAIEELGTYNPHQPDPSKKVRVKADRVNYWLGKGAQPTSAARTLLKQALSNSKETTSYFVSSDKTGPSVELTLRPTGRNGKHMALHFSVSYPKSSFPPQVHSILWVITATTGLSSSESFIVDAQTIGGPTIADIIIKDCTPGQTVMNILAYAQIQNSGEALNKPTNVTIPMKHIHFTIPAL